MSQKTVKKTTKPRSPRPPAEQVDTAYLVREDLDEEQERLGIAAAAEANPLQTPAAAAAAGQLPTAAASSKPLAPLAALWPSSVPPRAEAGPAQGPAPATAAPEKLISFDLFKPNATQVSLCGEFNGWSTSATSLQRHDDGHWETTVALAPGRYQYKFLVDGEWLLDPAAKGNVPNEHGTLNSVVEVRG